MYVSWDSPTVRRATSRASSHLRETCEFYERSDIMKNFKIYNSYEEYEKSHEDCQPKMNEVAVVYDGEYVCIDAIFDCKRVSTAVRRLFKNIDVNTIPEFDGWYETISESTENGYMSGFDTSCGDYHGWYGYYAWRVECNEDYIYISLKVRRETETEETVEEQPENVPEHETPETTTISEVKECEYCRECIHYGKCSVYAPEKMECRTVNKLLCGSVVCCEDFVSRKSIDDIYEEQKGEKIMTYHEMTKKYEERGLTDYQLRTLNDLKEIHGVDVQELSGYSGLSENNRKLFGMTVLRFYNAHGLNSRLELRPKAVNYVQEVLYYRNISEDEAEDIGIEIYLVDSDMRLTKKRLHRYVFEKGVSFKNCKKIIKHYLRFELKDSWYHFTDFGSWY